MVEHCRARGPLAAQVGPQDSHRFRDERPQHGVIVPQRGRGARMDSAEE
jgi:hypothetical protein